MKIGIVTSSLAKTDGWGRYSSEIISQLKNYGKVKVISHETESMDKIDFYPLLPYPLNNPLKLIYSSYKIARHLKDCDIIHCFVEPYAPVVAFSNLLLRKPLFITAHGTYAIRPLNKKGVDSLLMKFAYRRASKILAISSFTKNELLKKCSLGNIEVIPLGVNYEDFQKGKAKKEREEETIILSVGAVKARKGFDISIQAISRLQKERIKYYIVGDVHSSSFNEELQEIITSEGLAGKVEFLGKVSDKELVRLYHTCDIFLLTPRNVDFNVEGFGLVYLEANACGKPVIGTYGCGAEDAIINGYNGLLVPQSNPGKTAEAVEYLLNNPEEAQKMGDNGRKRAEELSWGNITKRIIAVYKSKLNEARRS